MKWMGFSYRDLMALPDYHLRTILEMMQEEVQRIEAARAKNG
jgi:hypothetical protein